jgi:membrane fusion protein (multidrug efflux system)
MSHFTSVVASLLGLSLLTLSGCGHRDGEKHEEHHKVVVTSPMVKDVVTTQQFVCQIHSSRHIEIRALENGYLEEIPIHEGQTVKKDQVLFQIMPTLYQAKLKAEEAEAQLAQIEYDNTAKLYQKQVVSAPELALANAKLAKAIAKVTLAKAELNFATIKAPFDGIIDMQRLQQGSLIAEGDKLTTLSDNSTMWVYFNVPEARYLEYKENPDKELKVELVLANGKKFPQLGKINAIEADFNNETGNIAFRADFPNPDRLLRHGQTGTVHLISTVKDALVIPQRATYEILAKKYVYVVDNEPPKIETKPHDEHGAKPDEHASAKHEAKHEQKTKTEEGYVHQREIVILNELDDIYLLKEGLQPSEKIVLEGVQQVRDGQVVEYEFLEPAKSLTDLKYHAE